MTGAPATGYLSERYAQSYAPFGAVVTLPRSGLHLISRPIAGGGHDLMGLYPYAMCRDWAALPDDLDMLRRSGAVSVTFVADPFAAEAVQAALGHWTLCRPFKTHVVVDLTGDWQGQRSSQTRRLARRGLEAQTVRPVPSSASYAPALWELYGYTIARHQVRGLARLSQETLAAQLEAPGAVLVLAEDATGLVGAMLSFVHGDTANYHLEFLAPRARDQNTSYALKHVALEESARCGCKIVNLGGSAGLDDDPEDGLMRFKRRWSPQTRQALLCGEILDPVRYAALSGAQATEKTGFFPAYRAP